MSAAGPSTDLRGTIVALSVGKVGILVHGGREVASGFRKIPTENRIQLDRTGLAGDQQGDLTVHGGPEKAVCVYSSSTIRPGRPNWNSPSRRRRSART